MKTKNTLMTTAIAAAIALNMSTTAADAGHGDDLSRYAHRIDSVAHELEDEFRIHYKHVSGYSHMRSDLSEIIKKVHHIDGLTHDCYASLRHISADLASLDRLAHHLHEVVDRAESGRYGHVHGNTRHVHSLLSSLNGAIHSMERVTESMRYRDRDHCDFDRGHGRDRGNGRHYESRGHDRGHSRSYSRAEFGGEVLRFVIESHRRHR